MEILGMPAAEKTDANTTSRQEYIKAKQAKMLAQMREEIKVEREADREERKQEIRTGQKHLKEGDSNVRKSFGLSDGTIRNFTEGIEQKPRKTTIKQANVRK
jgi:hypothetical protein